MTVAARSLLAHRAFRAEPQSSDHAAAPPRHSRIARGTRVAAVAELRVGETVLDLGSGGGMDVLLSARHVEPTGTAYGLDMTDEMLELARANHPKAGITIPDGLEIGPGTLPRGAPRWLMLRSAS